MINKVYSFNERLQMCSSIHEGCEAEDATILLIRAAKILHAFDNFNSNIILLIAEKLCADYVKNVLITRDCDWDEYNECDAEAFAYFSGGARKLTEEEFNKR